jgi:subtilase family serine protease
MLAQDADQDVQVGGPLQPGRGRPPLHVNTGKTSPTATAPAGYSPAQVRHAYGFDTLSATGTGQTIALVEAYGDPSIQTDLNTFCSKFGIPSTTVTIAYPQGKVSTANSAWALETALDVEWAHAIAPGAKILVVVCASVNLTDLLGGVDYAASHGATVVSMSWGAGEFSTESSYDFHFNVSYVADSSTGVAVYQGNKWYVVGGTSMGAPQWAALVALSNSSRTAGTLRAADSAIYSAAGIADTINPSCFFDITSGSNGTDPDDLAIAGYDLVTGVGSPNAGTLVPKLSTY